MGISRRSFVLLAGAGLLAGLGCYFFGWPRTGNERSSPLKGAFGAVYKQGDDYHLKLHIFQPDTLGNSRPAIIFFSGGGWSNCDIEQFEKHCGYFSSRGMVAIAAEYRVRSTHGVTPFECIADAKSAIRWVRSHAAELGVDPKLIVASGGSAGGHIAACAGTVRFFDEENENLEISSVPNALVLFNPVLDTSRWQDLFGERWRDASPLHNVNEGVPPTIIFHGTGDRTVPFGDTLHFASMMKSFGVRCEVVLFEGKEHGFFNYGRDRQAYIETVSAADRFLSSLGFLHGPPTIE